MNRRTLLIRSGEAILGAAIAPGARQRLLADVHPNTPAKGGPETNLITAEEHASDMQDGFNKTERKEAQAAKKLLEELLFEYKKKFTSFSGAVYGPKLVRRELYFEFILRGNCDGVDYKFSVDVDRNQALEYQKQELRNNIKIGMQRSLEKGRQK